MTTRAALVMLALVCTPAFAQAPAGKKAVTVHGYTRKTKNGKIVTVKSYTRTAGAKKVAKTTIVKGYTRKTKSGKIVTVKSYKRTAVTKMGGMTMGGAPKK